MEYLALNGANKTSTCVEPSKLDIVIQRLWETNDCEGKETSREMSSDLSTVLKHPLNHVKAISPHQCDQCDCKFPLQHDLDKHLVTNHVICKVVVHFLRTDSDASNLTDNELKDRMWYSSETKLICKICGLDLVTKQFLEKHLLKHLEARPHKCNVCDKAFKRISHLGEHKKIHKKPLFDCGQCEKAFLNNSKLNRHMRVHTGEKPFDCNVCGQTFRTTGNAKRHMRTHNESERFECLVCKKRMSSRNSLISHNRIHTGEKPHNCNICHKKFFDLSNLRRHLAGQHQSKYIRCGEC